MKFKENQEVFVIYKQQVFKGFILWFRKSYGVYIIDRFSELPFTDLKRGSEAIFETEQEAQEYLDNLER